MLQFVYTAWFRDTTLPSDDEDYEWPACFVVEAATASDALAWGDHLAHAFAKRSTTERYLSGEVEDVTPADLAGEFALPRVQHGYEASDYEIGW